MPDFFQSTNRRRQKLVKQLPEAPVPLSDGTVEGPEAARFPTVANIIKTREQLQRALVAALQLELATIPPYMCGLYSIHDGTNVEAARLIRSVLVEEMLHMLLVANLLNAISRPAEIDALLTVEQLMADYPARLPSNIAPDQPTPFLVHLLPFSEEAIFEFLTIERPADPNAPLRNDGAFRSIGQFYQSIRYGFEHLAQPGNLFVGEESRQITPEHYYGSGGDIVVVTRLEDANLAIEEIVGQGEGIDGTILDPDSTLFGQGIEYAHYFKFQEIRCGRLYQANDTNQQAPTKSIPTGTPFEVSYSTAHPMKCDPKVSDYEHDKDLMRIAIEFNRLYTRLISTICDAARGKPCVLRQAIPVMHELRERAKVLMNVRLRDGSRAGPTFEYTA